jgi:hypothetical protein
MLGYIFGNIFVGAVLVVFAATISFLSLSYFAAPYIWIAVTWIFVFICTAVLLPRTIKLWASLVFLSMVLGVIESYYWISDSWEVDQVRSEGVHIWVNDEVLGFVPNKGAGLRSAKFFGKETLYDTTISVGDNGLRVSPPVSDNWAHDKRCILFFGGAYTFGRGVADEETLPYRVGIHTDGKYRVYNFAFDPHGAHQMLAQLEHGLVDKAIDCSPREIKYVIYQAIVDHVRSAAGLRDRIDLDHGPQYALNTDGTIFYRGKIGEDHTMAEKIWRRLSKSYLVRRLAGGGGVYMRRYKSEDLKLYLAIVNSVSSRIRQTYPNSEFHVLVWGYDIYDKGLAAQMVTGLAERGIKVHRVIDILPSSDEDNPEYYIMNGIDPMPNSATHDRVAQYVVRKILR